MFANVGMFKESRDEVSKAQPVQSISLTLHLQDPPFYSPCILKDEATGKTLTLTLSPDVADLVDSFVPDLPAKFPELLREIKRIDGQNAKQIVSEFEGFGIHSDSGYQMFSAFTK